MPTTGIKQNPPDIEVWTEGKTDWKHLKKAAERLNIKKNISFQEIIEGDLGDQALYGKCRVFAQAPQITPKVFIFDRDNKQILKDVTADGGVKDWGNNVFSFALPTPPHRLQSKGICIEMYYSNTEIQTMDPDGRRLFLSHEFDETGMHKDDPSIRVGNRHLVKGATTEQEAKIIDSDVYRLSKAIGLSKTKFADCIANDVAPFANFNFEAFHLIFEILDQIVASTRPPVNLWFPDMKQFLALHSHASQAHIFLVILDSVFHLLSMALQLFIATTVRVYDNVIQEEPEQYKK